MMISTPFTAGHVQYIFKAATGVPCLSTEERAVKYGTWLRNSPISNRVARRPNKSSSLKKNNQVKKFLISNFRRVLNVICFLLGNSPAPELYMPTFRNTLFHLHRRVGRKNDWG